MQIQGPRSHPPGYPGTENNKETQASKGQGAETAATKAPTAREQDGKSTHKMDQFQDAQDGRLSQLVGPSTQTVMGFEPGSLALQVMKETVKAAGAELQADKLLKSTAQEAKINMKTTEIQDKASEINKERDAALAQAVTNVGVAVASAVSSIVGGQGEEAKVQVVEDMSSKQLALTGEVIDKLKSNDITGALSSWKDLGQQADQLGVPMDINAVIQYVLRESYLENNEDIQFYAEKVKFFNETKEKIRGSLKNMVNLHRGASTASMLGNKESIEDLEEKLKAIGDDAQLSNIDLQNMLQKQQQTIQTMSNVSKTMHDTALALIRKIG